MASCRERHSRWTIEKNAPAIRMESEDDAGVGCPHLHRLRHASPEAGSQSVPSAPGFLIAARGRTGLAGDSGSGAAGAGRLVVLEQGGQLGQEPGQGGAIARGEPVEQGGLGVQHVDVGPVDYAAAGRGELD